MKKNQKKGTCSCHVCQTELKAFLSCDLKAEAIDFEVIYTKQELRELVKKAKS